MHKDFADCDKIHQKHFHDSDKIISKHFAYFDNTLIFAVEFTHHTTNVI